METGLQLTILEGDGAGEGFLLRHPRILVGRAEPADQPRPDHLALHAPTVSREHAILEWDARKERFRLLHRSRTNQTLVNGREVRKTWLEPGDRIQLGGVLLLLEPAQAPPPRPLPPPGPPRPAAPPPGVPGGVPWGLRGTVDRPPPLRKVSLLGGLGPPETAPPDEGVPPPPAGPVELFFSMEVEDGPDRGRRFPVAGEVRLGRVGAPSPGGILLNDPGVRLDHALLKAAEARDHFVLRSLGGAVEVLGGGPPSPPSRIVAPGDWAEVRAGDRLLLGSTRLLLRAHEVPKLRGPAGGA